MPTSLSVAASKPKVKHSEESIKFGFDFTKLLRTGEALTGTPTVTCTAVTGSGGTVNDLTIASIAVNAAAFDNDEGGSVAIGDGVQARISGGVDGCDYTLECKPATDQSDTRVLICTLQVRDS